MNSRINHTLMILTILSVYSHAALAVDDQQQSWQLSLLFNPSDQQYEMERRGRVFIYDGLRDNQIEQALDDQYERIEGMMFVNTVLTDDNGVPLTDPQTGEVLVEDDGCD
jgi:hypothetical protein